MLAAQPNKKMKRKTSPVHKWWVRCGTQRPSSLPRWGVLLAVRQPRQRCVRAPRPRATTMETGLFEIQADYLHEFRQRRETEPKSPELIYARFGADSVDVDPDRASHGITNGTQARPISRPKSVDPATDLARCFLRLANLPNFALDRLSRYEATLWRQVGQILFALDGLDRRKPQERRRLFRVGGRQDLPADGRNY